MKRGDQKAIGQEVCSTPKQLPHQGYETLTDEARLQARSVGGVYTVSGLLEKGSGLGARVGFGFYEVDAWGEQLVGACAPQRCMLSGVAKRNSAAVPYAVANEFICARLGLLIGLPIPPGTVVTPDGGELIYVSLRFGPKGKSSPPIDPQEFTEDNPSVAAGVVAFDYWIGNADRHEHNLTYVRGDPTMPVTVFDHSHALLGTQAGAATQLLHRTIDRPLVSGILRQYISSGREFRGWAARISTVSSELVRDICQTIVHPDAITAEESTAAAEFLIHYKERILEKIRAAQARMPNVQHGELDEN